MLLTQSQPPKTVLSIVPVIKRYAAFRHLGAVKIERAAVIDTHYRIARQPRSTSPSCNVPPWMPVMLL